MKENCWILANRVYGHGYGQIGRHYSHRLSYETFVGPIPAGYVIDHLCSEPSCINPDHLEAVTQKENLFRARKPYCKRGHAMTPDNLYIHPQRGSAVCLACRNLSNKEVARKRKLGIYSYSKPKNKSRP